MHIYHRVLVGGCLMAVKHAALPNRHTKPIQAYIAGYVLAITLTVSAFALVWAYVSSDGGVFSRTVLLSALAVLAVLQLLVQAVFFLHLSAERKARLTLYSTLFTILVVMTIVVGSIWIMYNLNYNMMPSNVSKYIQQEENIPEH